MEKTYEITIGEVTRQLPIREVAPNISVALFDRLGDWELTEAAGKALSKLIPKEVEVLVMPDGKATSLLHVVGRETGLPTFVARKAKKPYMHEPVLEISVKSITTDKIQTLYLGADQVEAIKGKRVATLDDVVSTGGTLHSMHALYEQAGAQNVATIAIFTEGGAREDVICLGNLPLF